jgi:hypothetical protein
MSDLKIHPDDGHRHAPDCGHTAIKHEGHIDYVHDGHLHHPAGQTDSTLVEEHVIEIGSHNPVRCTPDHHCAGHTVGHEHGPGCGHEAIPHGGHIDYLVEDHLHYPHGDHCDDHGPVEVVRKR